LVNGKYISYKWIIPDWFFGGRERLYPELVEVFLFLLASVRHGGMANSTYFVK